MRSDPTGALAREVTRLAPPRDIQFACWMRAIIDAKFTPEEMLLCCPLWLLEEMWEVEAGESS